MDQTPTVTTFEYRCPEDLGTTKSLVRLARSDILSAIVQVVTEGGENNLHSHRMMDGLWFVLGGRARFYTTDDEVIGELGRGDGILVPRNYPYWFESVGDEPLELLQVDAIDRRVQLAEGQRDRVDHDPRRASFAAAQWTTGEEPKE